MQLITFLHEFIKHPKHTGAVAPSSKILAKKMVDVIDFNKAKCIVELGLVQESLRKNYEEKEAGNNISSY